MDSVVAEPTALIVSDEYVVEASYRWQVAPGLSLMPDLQALFNPSKHPTEDVVWVGGVRCVLSL